MAGWTCPDRELIVWDGTIQAKRFIGAGISSGSGGSITNLDGGNSADTYGAVGLSPIDGGDST